MNIIGKLQDKNLSASSISLYVRNLEKLNDDFPIKNLKFLENIENINKKLENYKPNTKRLYYISIVSVLNAIKGENKKLNKLADEYYKLMIQTSQEIKAKPTEEMSESQSKNWLKWDDIKNKLNELKEKVNNFVNNKLINETQYNTLLSYLILSLYFYLPPRRNMDYQLMNVVKLFNEKLSDDVNYLSYDDNKFVFNVYKTAKSKGRKEKVFNNELKEVINMYLKHHPIIKGKVKKDTNTRFLVYFNGGELGSVNSITRILNKIFDKNIGSSMIRHIYLSNKYGETMEEMKEDADDMGHTTGMQKEYIKTEQPKKQEKIMVNFS